MRPPLTCPVCKKDFFPKQQWIHAKCKVVLMVEPVANNESVANESVAKVANKHGVYKDKEKRLKYMRELMRKKRAGGNLRPA